MADDSLSQIRPTEIIKRAKAKAHGLTRYFTGKPCPYGHIAQRQVSSGACVECRRGRKHEWNALNKHRNSETYRQWIDKNRERKSESFRQWADKNHAKKLAYEHEWRRNNPDKKRALVADRRARKRGADGSFSAHDVRHIRKLQRNCCARCRDSLKYKTSHIDHIVPIAAGGSNNRTNIQLLCAPCNLSKGSRDPIDDARRIGRLL